MTSQIIFAGFGGQGILFSGKFLAYNGLIAGKYLSWLPSYGPEMRGGTANCSVILSDTPVGSPIVTYPDMLVVMNNPSLDKYEDAVVPGGRIFVDSSLIERKVKRTDVDVFYIPATAMAAENGLGTISMQQIADSVKDIARQMHERDSRISMRLFRLREKLRKSLVKEGLLV